MTAQGEYYRRHTPDGCCAGNILVACWVRGAWWSSMPDRIGRRPSSSVRLLPGGRVTVAAIWRGEGTDIPYGREVIGRGGLHVIATERHHDSHASTTSYSDALGRRQRIRGPIKRFSLWTISCSLTMAVRLDGGSQGCSVVFVGPCLAGSGLCCAKGSATRRRLQTRMRRAVLKMDEQLDSTLAFGGRSGMGQDHA